MNNPKTSQQSGLQKAQVVVNYGRHLLIESDEHLLEAVTRGRKMKPVCGDWVSWSSDGKQAVIEDIDERHGILQRHDPREGQRILATNVDVLFVVMAAKPTPDLALVDRYLVAAEALKLEAQLVFNKCDLLDANELNKWREQLQLYLNMGYPAHWVQTQPETDIASLYDALKNRCGIFVGPSGAGKSSMIKSLVPDHAPRTQSLSEASGQGQHTTTATRLYRMPKENGGSIIDSPGVRDFRLWQIDIADLPFYFREFKPYIGHCRFSDCRHIKEPDCAVKDALKKGQIDENRYASYCQLAEVMSS